MPDAGAESEGPGTDPEEVERIVVTTDYRRRSVDDLPSSITVLPAEVLQQREADHLEEVLTLVPNLNYSGASSRARTFQIRGVSDVEQFEAPLNSSVGVLIDDMDFSGAATVATLYDVERVEVLRGPQGTRYGANALAGLIRIKTNDPTERFEARADLDAANFGSYGLGGVVSGPIVDNVLYRVAARQYLSNGFIENANFGVDDTNDRDQLSIRAKLRVYATEQLRLDFHASRVNVDNGYDAFSIDNTRTTFSDEPGSDRQRSDVIGFAGEWQASESFDVEAIAAYATSDILYSYDEDWTFEGFHPDGYRSTDAYARSRDTFNGELRAVSRPAGRLFGGRSDWVVGLYGITQDVDLQRDYTFLPERFTSSFRTERVAAFAQLETRVFDELDVIAGVRGEYLEQRYDDSSAVTFSPSESLFTGRLGVDYTLATDVMVYGLVSRGAKAGGFNTDGTLDEDLRLYGSESLWNYEVGMKGRWFGQRLRTRLSAFFMDRDDVQLGSSILRGRPDGSTEFVTFVGNAAEGTNLGLEAEISWRATSFLEVFSSLGLLDTEFQEFTNAAGEDISGRAQAHAPGYQFNAGGLIRIPRWGFARLEAEGRDAFFYSERHDQRSEAFALVHATVGYERGPLRVALWGRNLFNQDYGIRGFFFGNDPRNGFSEQLFTQLGEPRRFGVSLTLRTP